MHQNTKILDSFVICIKKNGKQKKNQVLIFEIYQRLNIIVLN